MNALSDARVVNFLTDRCVATYLKVGTFQIINGQKVGGNVASYFCEADGAVLHAIPGKVNADKLLSEARWALETRKLAWTLSTDLGSGVTDPLKFRALVQRAHAERYLAETSAAVRARGLGRQNFQADLQRQTALPRHVSQQGQAHWLLARNPLAKLGQVYPVVWQDILRENLSGLPVAVR